jgi:membrane-associated phospholipid phosphatase
VRPAARGAALVTLAYLLLMLPVALWGARSVTGLLFAASHVIAAICVWWSIRSTGKVADWLPLLLMPFLYAELRFLIGPAAMMHDRVVQGWEVAVFGEQPARTLAGRIPSAAMSELLHLAYLLYYPIVYVPPLLLYLASRYEEYGQTVLALMLTYAVCFALFVLFPVEGPRYAWGAPAGVPVGSIRSLTLVILERGSSRGTAFPSSHAAVAAAQAVAALRYQRGVGVVVMATSMLLMIGAVYGGFHYAVDIIAGAVLGVAIASIVLTRPLRA